jgi:hypothetical protein
VVVEAEIEILGLAVLEGQVVAEMEHLLVQPILEVVVVEGLVQAVKLVVQV